MSDQADRLRQLVGASRAATALADDEPWPTDRRPCRDAASPRTTRSLALYQRQRGRRDVEPGPEPGDRAGGDGPARRGGGCRPRAGEPRSAVRADAAVRPGGRAGGPMPLVDAVVAGPGDIQIVPGAHAMRTRCGGPGRRTGAAGRGAGRAGGGVRLRAGGCGLGPGAGVATLAAAADQVVIVSTPEPTSIADAHAAISRFRRLAGSASAARCWSTRPPRPPRPPTSWTGWSPRAGSSWARWFRRWVRGPYEPTPTSPWRSAAAGRS